MFNFMKPIDPTINCIKCGGSIIVGANSCTYCGTKHDRDLAVLKYGMEHQKTDRVCPNCTVELDSKLIYSYPGEPDIARLNELLRCPDREREEVRYRDCPVCSRMMARKNFGFRSGVVMDVCPIHGTWLDGGELSHIIKWSSAGGQNSTCPIKERNDKLNQEYEKRKLKLNREKMEEQKRKERTHRFR